MGKMNRTDSGYSSNPEGRDLLYDMLVDDFFYPPEEFDCTFGDFTVNEIQQMDEDMGAIYEELYGSEESGKGV